MMVLLWIVTLGSPSPSPGPELLPSRRPSPSARDRPAGSTLRPLAKAPASAASSVARSGAWEFRRANAGGRASTTGIAECGLRIGERPGGGPRRVPGLFLCNLITGTSIGRWFAMRQRPTRPPHRHWSRARGTGSPTGTKAERVSRPACPVRRGRQAAGGPCGHLRIRDSRSRGKGKSGTDGVGTAGPTRGDA